MILPLHLYTTTQQ